MTGYISIVVPARNSALSIMACLEALAGQSFSRDRFDITVTDDGSVDATGRIILEFIGRNPGLAVHYDKVNFASAGRTRNAGALGAKGDWILFLDADVICPTDLLARLGARLAAHGDADVFQGVYSRQTPCNNFFSVYKNLYTHFALVNLGDPVRTVYGSVFAIRRTAFLGVGGFDPAYAGASIEDRALAERLLDRGHRIILCPEIAVAHNKCYTWTSFTENQFRRSCELAVFFLQGHQRQDLLKTKKFGTHSLGELARLPVVWAMPLALLSAMYRPPLLIIFAGLGLAYFFLRRKFLGFLAAERGLCFALLGIMADLYDVFVCGLGIIRGCLRYWVHV